METSSAETIPVADGRHLEAYFRQEQLYLQTLRELRQKNDGTLRILDFGCGRERKGVSRVLLEGRMRVQDDLALYDPYLPPAPPRSPGVRIVTAKEIFGTSKTKFDGISASYVFCTMKPDDALRKLRELRQEQPQATYIIVDYTLQTREACEVLALLNAQEELWWKRELGVEKFLEIHQRFTKKSLAELVMGAGLHISKTQSLDEEEMRCAIIAN